MALIVYMYPRISLTIASVTVEAGTDQIATGYRGSLPVQDSRAGELLLNNCIIFNSFIEVPIKSFHIHSNVI